MKVSVAFLLVALSCFASSSAFFPQQKTQHVPYPQQPMQPHEAYYFCKTFYHCKARYEIIVKFGSPDQIRCLLADLLSCLKELAARLNCPVSKIFVVLRLPNSLCLTLEKLGKSLSLNDITIITCKSILEGFCRGLSQLVSVQLQHFLGELKAVVANLPQLAVQTVKTTCLHPGRSGTGYGGKGDWGRAVGGAASAAGSFANGMTNAAGSVANAAGNLASAFTGGLTGGAAGLTGAKKGLFGK